MKKDEKVELLFKRLNAGVQEFYSSEKWAEFLLFQSRFHTYSFSNALLIYSQCPFATRVAGFNKWKEMGRFVKKGQTAIQILAPVRIKKKDEETGEENYAVIGFKHVNVFDISQTDGKELPRLCEELQGNDEALEAFYNDLKEIIKIPVVEKEIEGGAKGYYNLVDDYIAVKKSMAYEHKCKTLIHEYTHSLLHRKDNERKLSSSEMEIEAEGTAFVVASYFGLDTSDYSFPYCASWTGGEKNIERIRSAGDIIQKTACKIIEQIEKLKTDEVAA